MNENSKNFFNELRELLAKYDAQISSDYNGDLLVYVGEEIHEDLVVAEADFINDYLNAKA